jgi:hypothetical protein
MIIRTDTIKDVTDGYRKLDEFYKDIRSLFQIIDVRFRIEEYGVKLKCISENQLFSNANGYMLDDKSPYPFYLWIPSWLGRFYVDPERVPEGIPVDCCHSADARLLAFVWTWLGFGDAYVADVDEPECWFGIAEPEPEDRFESIHDIAAMVWKYFRVETTCTGETDGWLTGRFDKNDIGCSLNGRWVLKRFPLAKLTTFYEVETRIVRPLGKKFKLLREESKEHSLVGGRTD